MSSTDAIAAADQSDPVPAADSAVHSMKVTEPEPSPSAQSTPAVAASPSSTDSSSSTSTAPPSLPASVFAHVWWLGAVVLHGLEAVGEALADFLGITSSPYQYVIDAKERQERWQRMEEAEEETARAKFEEELRQQQAAESSRLEEGHTAAVTVTAATAATPSPSLPIT